MGFYRKRRHQIELPFVDTFANANCENVHVTFFEQSDWFSEAVYSSCTYSICENDQDLQRTVDGENEIQLCLSLDTKLTLISSCLSVCLSACACFLPVCLLACFCLSVCLSACMLSVCLSVCLHAFCLSVCLLACFLSVCLCDGLSVCLSVPLPVDLFMSFFLPSLFLTILIYHNFLHALYLGHAISYPVARFE